MADKNQQLAGQTLIATRCPSCGGFLSADKGDRIECEYCGSSFLLNQARSGGDEAAQHLHLLAAVAQEAGDEDEAYAYFTRILEKSPEDAMAWYGKGVTVLGRSTALNIRDQEALTYFAKAMERVDTARQDGLNQQIAKTCWHYGRLLHTWLQARGWFDRDTFSRTMGLFFAADRRKPAGVPGLKFLVNTLCAHSGLGRFDDKIRELTERIRTVEPKYKNPREIAARNGITMAVGGFLFLILLIVLIVYAISNK